MHNAMYIIFFRIWDKENVELFYGVFHSTISPQYTTPPQTLCSVKYMAAYTFDIMEKQIRCFPYVSPSVVERLQQDYQCR
jgi:hypothetical protein